MPVSRTDEPVAEIVQCGEAIRQAAGHRSSSALCHTVRLPQRPKRGTQPGRKELGLFPRGEVSALGNFVEVTETRVGTASPALGRQVRIFSNTVMATGNEMSEVF